MVPEGWETITLKDVGKCITGLTYSPRNVAGNGLLVLRSSNIQDSKLAFEDNVYVDLNIAKESETKYGDILLCVRNGSRRLIGKSAFITKTAEGYAHGAFMGLFRPDETAEFTFQMFQSTSFFRQVNQNLGATINSINSGNLYRFKFHYPPIEERNKIAKILSTWDKAISTTESLIDNSKQQKKALMQQLLTGKKRFLRFDGDWEDKHLNEVAQIIVSPVDKKTIEGETPVELCNYTDVYYNIRITNTLAFMKATAKQSEIDKYSLQAGDVIITKDSETPGDIAVPALVSEDLNGVLCGYHLAIVRPSKDQIHDAFLNYLFSMQKTRYYFFTLATGATRFGLSVGAINKAHFRIPPLEEQKKIALVLTNADKEIELLKQQLSDLKQEKKALMQQLLTGKRRVKIETNDFEKDCQNG